jgi:hypothetical protein
VSEASELASLLEVAREVLRTDLAPALEPDGRYKAAMVANVLAIAARALRTGPLHAAAELDALRRLLPGAERDRLDPLRRRVVAEIRAGRFDGPDERVLRACLRARVEARLAISNPEYRI